MFDPSELLKLIATVTPLAQVLDAVVKSIENHLSSVQLVVLLTDDGEHLRLGAAPSLTTQEFRRAVDGLEIGPAAMSCGTAAYRLEAVIVQDIARDSLWNGYQQMARQLGVRACWSLPVVSSESRLLGTIGMYCAEPRGPTDAERKLMDIAAQLTALVIERERTRDALTQSLHRLEQTLSALTETEQQLANAKRVQQVSHQASEWTHELNNVLSPILAYSQMLQSMTDMPDGVQTWLKEIAAAATDATVIVERLQRLYCDQVGETLSE